MFAISILSHAIIHLLFQGNSSQCTQILPEVERGAECVCIDPDFGSVLSDPDGCSSSKYLMYSTYRNPAKRGAMSRRILNKYNQKA